MANFPYIDSSLLLSMLQTAKQYKQIEASLNPTVQALAATANANSALINATAMPTGMSSALEAASSMQGVMGAASSMQGVMGAASSMKGVMGAASSMKGVMEAASSMKGVMGTTSSSGSSRSSTVRRSSSEGETDDNEQAATTGADSHAPTATPGLSNRETRHRGEPDFFSGLTTYGSPSRSPQEFSMAVLDVWELVLPNRIRNEELAGYVEHINQLDGAGASAWRIYTRTAFALFWTSLNSIRLRYCLLLSKLMNEFGRWWAGG